MAHIRAGATTRNSRRAPQLGADPQDESPADTLITENYYDLNSRLVAVDPPNTGISFTKYDGVGRQMQTLRGTQFDAVKYTNAAWIKPFGSFGVITEVAETGSGNTTFDDFQVWLGFPRELAGRRYRSSADTSLAGGELTVNGKDHGGEVVFTGYADDDYIAQVDIKLAERDRREPLLPLSRSGQLVSGVDRRQRQRQAAKNAAGRAVHGGDFHLHPGVVADGEGQGRGQRH